MLIIVYELKKWYNQCEEKFACEWDYEEKKLRCY